MNVLFMTCAPPEKSIMYTLEKRPPNGMGTLMSIVRNNGHNIHFIDNFLHHSNQFDPHILMERNIDHVGIYLSTICFEHGLDIFNSIKKFKDEMGWKGTISVGGPHVKVSLDTIPDFVDYKIIGEAEEIILEIIEGKLPPGVYYPERLKNLDSLPFEPWDIFSKLPYNFTIPWDDTAKNVFTLNTSRGCAYKCKFCSATSIWDHQFTFMSAQRIIEEIQYLIENYNADGIYFREDNFTLNRKRLYEFCNLLINRNISISWACETRINHLNEELIHLMKKSGCVAVYIGVESGSQRMLNIMNKKEKIKDIYSTSKKLHQYGIKQYFSMVVGLPHESIIDYILTLKLLKDLKPEFIGFQIYVGLPGSELYQNLINKQDYEYKDNLGCIYRKGFQVKYQYFWNINVSDILHFNFKEKTIQDFIYSFLLKLGIDNNKVLSFILK